MATRDNVLVFLTDDYGDVTGGRALLWIRTREWTPEKIDAEVERIREWLHERLPEQGERTVFGRPLSEATADDRIGF